MKVLLFTPDTYDIVYEAMILGGNFKSNQLGIVLKIFDKLDSIGKLRPGAEGEAGLRSLDLTVIDPSIQFEDAEFELLKVTFDNVSWGGRGARKAAITYSWLTSISTS